MARSIYSGSPSPSRSSPSSASESPLRIPNRTTWIETTIHGEDISPPSSPDHFFTEGGDGQPIVEDSVTCEWDSCGKVYTHLPTLIEHIHSEHIGVHKSSYSCQWASCTRRGLAQTSRFALISHIRSHTGEKPFICTLPECDKSFTRSDALAKHMRLQHAISPPAPGRGGSRKRKRNGANDPGPSTSGRPSDVANEANHRSSNKNQDPPGGGFGQFKVEPHTPSEIEGASMLEGGDSNSYFGGANGHTTNGHGSTYPMSPSFSLPPMNRPPSPLDILDQIPPHLRSQYDESTGTIMGRTPHQIMYLITKAKYKYAKQQQDELMEELRISEAELARLVEDKERLLDDVLRVVGGPEADQFILPVAPPEAHHDSRREGSPNHHGTEHGIYIGVNGNGY